MAIIKITLTNTLSQLVSKTNLISEGLGDVATIPGSSTNAVTAIQYLDSDLGQRISLINPATSIVTAINTITSETGNLSDLDTTDKTSIIAAINELNLRIPGIYDTTGTLLND